MVYVVIYHDIRTGGLSLNPITTLPPILKVKNPACSTPLTKGRVWSHMRGRVRSMVKWLNSPFSNSLNFWDKVLDCQCKIIVTLDMEDEKWGTMIIQLSLPISFIIHTPASSIYGRKRCHLIQIPYLSSPT